MVGTHGPRMLEATVQHVQTWNTWYAWYGNSVDGFAALSATVEADVRRSTCALVTVDGGGGERALEPTAPPVEAERLAAHLAALAAAGGARRSSSSIRSTSTPLPPLQRRLPPPPRTTSSHGLRPNAWQRFPRVSAALGPLDLQPVAGGGNHGTLQRFHAL
jgi:hypothetical protein